MLDLCIAGDSVVASISLQEPQRQRFAKVVIDSSGWDCLHVAAPSCAGTSLTSVGKNDASADALHELRRLREAMCSRSVLVWLRLMPTPHLSAQRVVRSLCAEFGETVFWQ